MSVEETPKGWRRRTATVALVLGCVALFVANLGLFLRAFVFDDDTFVDAVAPEQPDEQVVDGVAETLSIRILDATDVQERIQDLTPRDNPLVAAAVANAAGGVIEDVVHTVLDSDSFRTVWRTAVEQAHERFVNLVEDDDREPVLLNLTSLVSQVDERLEARGIDLLDDDTIQEIGEVVTVRRSQVAEVREGLNLLRRGSLVAAGLAIVLLVAAMALATDRRRMLARMGVGIAVTMLVTAIAVRFGRRIFLDHFEVTTRRDAVGSVWNRVFSTLADQTVALLLLGVLVAAGAWLVGPSSRATALRSKVGSLRHRSSSGSSTATPQDVPGPA